MTRDRVRLQFELCDGSLTVADLDTGEQWTLYQLERWYYKADAAAPVKPMAEAPGPVFQFAAACLELRKGIR